MTRLISRTEFEQAAQVYGQHCGLTMYGRHAPSNIPDPLAGTVGRLRSSNNVPPWAGSPGQHRSKEEATHAEL